MNVNNYWWRISVESTGYIKAESGPYTEYFVPETTIEEIAAFLAAKY